MCTPMMQTNTVPCGGPSASSLTIKRSVVAIHRDGQHAVGAGQIVGIEYVHEFSVRLQVGLSSGGSVRLGIDIETAGEAATALTRRAGSDRSGQIHGRQRALSCPPVGSFSCPPTFCRAGLISVAPQVVNRGQLLAADAGSALPPIVSWSQRRMQVRESVSARVDA